MDQPTAESLRDPSERYTILESVAFVALLENCVIGPQYRVPDALVRPIALTSLGEEIRSRLLQSKKRLRPNDATLAVFLEVGCPDGMLFSSGTDVDALRAALNKEVLSRRIQYVNVWGRELHDLSAKLHPRKTVLTNSQSISLLRELPIGVFQQGRTVVGPFGAVLSNEPRRIPATTHAPGYLCSDLSCTKIHSIELQTAQTAIHRARRLVEDHIQKHHKGEEDPTVRMIVEASMQDYDPNNPLPSESLFDAIGDALSTTELRSLVANLLRDALKRNGGSSQVSRNIGVVIANPTDFAQTLDRSQALQLLMTFDNRSVIGAVDAEVRDGSAPFAEYEIRSGRLNRSRATERTEIGRLGARSVRDGAVARRLIALLHRLYFESGIMEPDDLAYGLGVPEASIDLLGAAVRGSSAAEIVSTLILAQRRAAREACVFLNIQDGDTMPRADLLEVMLWRLGAPPDVVFSEIERMSRHESELRAACASGASPEILRGEISNLFAAVEDVLQRALTYCIWALTHDHYASPPARSFKYKPDVDPRHLEFLADNDTPSNSALLLKANGKNTLVPLAGGFGRLAKALGHFDPDDYCRPLEQWPLLCRDGTRPFTFAHTLPFLWLSDHSRSVVLASLRHVSSTFSDDVVLKVRNATVHGNNEFPSRAEIDVALDRIRDARNRMMTAGLFPQVFNLSADSRDALGRTHLRYVRSEESVNLYLPTWPFAPRMPSRGSQLIVFQAAELPSVGPLRFSLGKASGFDEYWDGWPIRWEAERAFGVQRSASEEGDGAYDTQEASSV